MVLLDGKCGSGRVASMEYLGQIMGRTLTEVGCHSWTTQDNMLEYLKIGASGIFLILSHMENLSHQCISAFSQNMLQFWLNYQLARSQVSNFKLESKQLLLDVQNFTLIGTCQSISHFENVNLSTFKQCFRNYSICPINLHYYLKCILLSVGVPEIDEEFSLLISDILSEIDYQRRQGNLIGVNRNKFVCQVARKIQ